MATITSVTADHSDTSTSSFTTASITPKAKTLYLVAVSVSHGGVGNDASVSGCGITWTEIRTVANGNARISLFRGMATSPSAGALTISFSGQNQSNVYWSVNEVTGTVDDSASNGSNLIIQSGTVSTNQNDTSSSITLSALAHSYNVTFGCLNINGNNGAISVGSGFAQLSEVGTYHLMNTDWSSIGALTNTWTYPAINTYKVGIGIEIASLAPATGGGLTLTGVGS